MKAIAAALAAFCLAFAAQAHVMDDHQCRILALGVQGFAINRDDGVTLSQQQAVEYGNLTEALKSGKTIIQDKDDVELVKQLLTFVYQSTQTPGQTYDSVLRVCKAIHANPHLVDPPPPIDNPPPKDPAHGPPVINS